MGNANVSGRQIITSNDHKAHRDKREPLTLENQTDERDRLPLVVIALDFGTTFTGYAFSFKTSRDTFNTGLHGRMLEDDRVPTVMLLNPDKTFNSFGYNAQRTYTDLLVEDRDKYYYFENFKMALFKSEKVHRGITIKDNRGREANAMQVITTTIKHFRDMAFKMAKLSSSGLSETSVQWVLAIPAISIDSAKQFMREAAVFAGIKEDQLRLVLEPEAASCFCRKNKILATAETIETLPVGHKYILADLGGGTADICVHELKEEGKLQELYKATGGDLGGNKVNEAYVDFIKDLFGEKVWDQFCSRYLYPHFDMLKVFESRKKTFSVNEPDTIRIIVETALLRLLQTETGESLESKLDQSRYGQFVQYEEGRLIIKKEQMEQFFLPTVNGIIEKLQEILDSCRDHDIKTLMLVGGFAECPYLRERIQSKFTDLRVIMHQDTRLAVLKGAVMMGFSPKSTVKRRARLTYGFSYKAPFVEGQDRESLRVKRDDRYWCEMKFHKMIEIGQLLERGEEFVCGGYNTASDPGIKFDNRYTRLWRSTRTNPRYCLDEEECELVGYIILKPPSGGWPDYWQYQRRLVVGDTELTVKEINITTGEEYEVTIDFL